jgi:uncharacterized protein
MRLAARPQPRYPIADGVSTMLDDAAGDIGPDERGMLAFADGVLTGAAISPQRTLPHEWVRAVFQDQQFENIEMAQASYTLLAIMYNQILSELQRMGCDYAPRFLDYAAKGEEIGLAGHWAWGLVTGLQLRPDVWRTLIGSQEAKTILTPIVVLLTKADGKTFLTRVPAEFREEAVHLIGPAVYDLYRHCSAHRGHSAAAFVAPVRKIGRNEPCPCRSGKKYKKCCLDRAA